MEESENLSKNNSLRLKTQQSFRSLGLCSQMTNTNVQQTSPIVFPEKRGNNRGELSLTSVDVSGHKKEPKDAEQRIDIPDEQSDLLGHEVLKGKLHLDKRRFNNNSEIKTLEYKDSDFVDAKLTTETLIWDSHMLHLDHVVSLSYSDGSRFFTVHAYPFKKVSCSLFHKRGRSRKDFRFIASTSEDAVRWVNGFADQRCYVNCMPCLSASKQRSDSIFNEFPLETCIKCKSPPKMLVILNPRSGHGRSSKVFHGSVEPIFKLAGFQLEIVNTTSAGHARKLAANVDLSACPDGIICVGGDGIINEVLNGLLNRDNQKEAISVPIGIIPAGSDNSLVWTVLGVRDPVSAAIAIIKGGLTSVDVFALEWIRTGAIHFGMIATYFGFVSDVLELSGKYQKRFGPLRYFIAGFLKFLCLPKYSYEVEYIPAESKPVDSKHSTDQQKTIDMSELYIDIMRRSSKEGLPRASSMSSIESIITPSQTSGADLDGTDPSDCVRAIDPKSKRLSQKRTNTACEPEEVISHSVTPNWARSRSKSRTDRAWAGLTTTNVNDPTRSSRVTNDREDISSTISDPGPIWDGEPKWDTEPNWDLEDPPVELPGRPEAYEMGPKPENNNWVVRKGQFLCVLICNHSCKSVQNSQVVAPSAEHDDGNLDLLMVHGSGRLRLLRFFVLLQMGRHLTLPYVEYIKVKQVKVRALKNTHNGCGIDGELFPLNGPVICSLLPERSKLIGRSSSCSRS